MALKRIDLIDKGYVDENGDPVDIAGRDNISERFTHLGYIYPEGVNIVGEVPGQYVVVEVADEPVQK